jgi:glycosyltransferase involved in cell wall biosynthesis
MKQVLWLASWYPNKFDAYNGDFIQRHAQAAAPYCKPFVLHVQLVPSSFQLEKVEFETIQQNHFQEQIVYVKESNLPFPLNKIANQFNYERYFRKAITHYMASFGKPDLVHVHVPVKAGKLALWLKAKFGIPYLLTEHYGIYNNYAIDKYADRSWWFKWLTKNVIEEADKFLPVSNSLGEAVNKLVMQKPFHAVYNVVDTTIFNYQPQLSTSDFWFIHVSTMDHPKNAEGILRAFANAFVQNNTLRLRMVGPASEILKQLAISLKLSDVVCFTGMLLQYEVARLMQQSHAFVLFSNYENMPCVIAEALCCGLPVISSDVGGIAEVINQNNGLLISPKDEAVLTKAMLEMQENLASFNQQEIAKNSATTFAYKTIGKQISACYEEFR